MKNFFIGLSAVVASVLIFLLTKNYWLDMFLEFKKIGPGSFVNLEQEMIFIALTLLYLALGILTLAGIFCILRAKKCEIFWAVSFFWLISSFLVGTTISVFFVFADKKLIAVELVMKFIFSGFAIGIFRGIKKELFEKHEE